MNEEWDRLFLQLIKEKDFDSLRKWTSEFIEENGGNGGQEIRNWLVLLGALQSFESDVAFYEPIPEWVTGMAIVQLLSHSIRIRSKIGHLNYEVRM